MHFLESQKNGLQKKSGNLPSLLPQKEVGRKSLDLEQVLCGYLVLFITPGSQVLPPKEVGRKCLDLEQVFCGYLVLFITPGSHFLPPKEVRSQASGSRARVERVFGFVCNPRFPPLFVTAKRSGKQRVWIQSTC